MRYFIIPFLLLATFISSTAQDKTIDIEVNGLSLCGALRIPARVSLDTCLTQNDTCYVCDTMPVVIMIHDEGRWNFNGNILVTGGAQSCLNPDLVGRTLAIFKDLADEFDYNGIASFRYCKRTFLYGSNVLDPITQSPRDYISDAAGVVESVKTILDSLGIPAKIYLLGHGQGGHLLPEITDSLTTDVIDGYISINSSAVGVDTTRAEYIELLFDKCLQLPSQSKAAYDTVLNTYGDIRQMKFPHTTKVISTLPNGQKLELGYPYFSESWMDITDKFLDKYNSYNKRSLFIHGDKDQFINPINLLLFEERTTLDDAQYVYANGVKHLMVEANNSKVSPAVYNPIIEWLKMECDTFTNITTHNDDIVSETPFIWDSGNKILKITEDLEWIELISISGQSLKYLTNINSPMSIQENLTYPMIIRGLDKNEKVHTIKIIR